MNCERNICYQQEYNGGCDTCPCNRTAKEAIENLKKLKSFHNGSYGSSIRMAIEALEKQVPKEPIKLNCPHCGFNGIDNSWSVFIFCPECGQALDWSEEDE